MLADSLGAVLCSESQDMDSIQAWLPTPRPCEPSTPKAARKWSADWQHSVLQLVVDYSALLQQKLYAAASFEGVEKQLLLLKSRVTEMERTVPTIALIETFAPDPYEVVKPFHVVVQPQNEEFIASFFDANLSATGDTVAEAIFNLKDIIVAVYECLAAHDVSKLGPGPTKQFQVLQLFIRKSA